MGRSACARVFSCASGSEEKEEKVVGYRQRTRWEQNRQYDAWTLETDRDARNHRDGEFASSPVVVAHKMPPVFVTSDTRGVTAALSISTAQWSGRVCAEETALSLLDPVAHAVAGSLASSPIELAEPYARRKPPRRSLPPVS
ncbi:hypothetical protein MTO96_002765 [Rhipicephalus appendiculatus]